MTFKKFDSCVERKTGTKLQKYEFFSGLAVDHCAMLGGASAKG
jgi:hypothetical protein